jgi:hypothetical protein
MNRDERIAVVSVVAILLAAPAMVVAAQTLTHSATAGTTYVTNSNVEVTLSDDRDIDAQPFPSDDSWTEGNLTVSGSNASVTVGDAALSDGNGTEITVTDVSVGAGGELTLERTDSGETWTITEGDADTVQLRAPEVDDGTTDIGYANSNNGLTVRLTDLPSIGIAAVDSGTGDPLDTAVVDNSGEATFELPQTSSTRSVRLESTPSELEVRNEANPDELIDGNVTLRARLFAGGDVIEREVTNGTVSLDGVPLDEELVVTVKEVNADFTYRRILLESAVQTSEIYLLPTDTPSAEVRFELADETGRFSADDTKLFVEKPITRDNSTEYRVISGDRIGADGQFPTILVDSERYRLRIENDAGEQRVLGSYTVQGAEVARIPIGEVEFSADVSEGPALQASLREAPEDAAHDHEARIVYLDPEGETDSIEISVENETGEPLRPTTTEELNGTTEAYVETYPLSTDFDPETESATVTVEAQRGFETETFEEYIGDVPAVFADAPIDPFILELMGFVSLIALVGLLVIVNPPLAALVGSGYAGLLSLLGIVPIPMPAVVLSGLVGVLAVVGTNTGVLR